MASMNIAQGGELPNIEAKLSPKKHYCRKIRRQGQVSAEMLGKILTKGCNRRERFIADSGTTIPIVPASIAARNKVDVVEVDPDEPGVLSASGHDLTIIGQATFYVKFDIIQNPKKMRVLVCKEEGDEILIDVQSLVEWSILPPNFPEPQDPKEKVRLTKSVPKTKLAEVEESKGSERTSIKFPRSQEE
jgi:lambda repressor-like predicted transcriptional regulator